MVKNRHDRLICDYQKKFWISWDEGTIKAGKGDAVDGDTEICWQDPSPLPQINQVFVSSDGNQGTWYINIPNSTLATDFPL